MRRFSTCSWCHELNHIEWGKAVFCWSCGHRADRPRMLCDCSQCPPPRERSLQGAARDPDAEEGD